MIWPRSLSLSLALFIAVICQVTVGLLGDFVYYLEWGEWPSAVGCSN